MNIYAFNGQLNILTENKQDAFQLGVLWGSISSSGSIKLQDGGIVIDIPGLVVKPDREPVKPIKLQAQPNS